LTPLTPFYFEPREYIQQEDLTKAARKVGEAKKHESKHAPSGWATSFLIVITTAKLDVTA
jgi:hypothetical protein